MVFKHLFFSKRKIQKQIYHHVGIFFKKSARNISIFDSLVEKERWPCLLEKLVILYTILKFWFHMNVIFEIT